MNAMRNDVCIHWFRHGLRLHDNPALLDSLKNCAKLYPIFIFDGEVAGTKTAGYNRMQFLLECLKDLDQSLAEFGGRLHIFYGNSRKIIHQLIDEWGATKLTFEVDPEPIWAERDIAIEELCEEKDVQCISHVSHTLWDPKEIIDISGGSPPLTFRLLCQATRALGQPPRPVEDPCFDEVELPINADNAKAHCIPKPQHFGLAEELVEGVRRVNQWPGGESRALSLLTSRLKIQKEKYSEGFIVHEHINPDMTGEPTSLSPHLRFGSLSVRRFYWGLRDTFNEVYPADEAQEGLTSQLLWREYFYTMSVNNINYNKMKENEICLNIPWYNNDQRLDKWAKGETGFPFVDAVMKQLRVEGWVHHVARHLVSCFLTRGHLWLSWEDGLKIFDKYLLDADWSVCAGNWMWVSSSAFEKFLQCPQCLHPVYYGLRMDPTGEYVKRYLPALRHMPLRYLFEPWKAPIEVQKQAGCVVGVDYPLPMIDHDEASSECAKLMSEVKTAITRQFDQVPRHCAPSDEEEVRHFSWLPNLTATGNHCEGTDLCDGIEAL